MKVKWNGNFQENIFRKFGHTLREISYSALASSFGRDHGELDISRKDDSDAHSINETLKNLSTYMLKNSSYS